MDRSPHPSSNTAAGVRGIGPWLLMIDSGEKPWAWQFGKINSINRLALLILWVSLCAASVSHVLAVMMNASDDSDDVDGDV